MWQKILIQTPPFSKLLAKMSSHTWPEQELQDDKSMDHEVQRQTFPESVVPDVASVLGARSLLAGIASAVRSLLGPRLEAPPPTKARAHERPNANMIDADARVEPPTSLDASVPPDEASHHRSFSDVGANGPAPDAPHSSVSHNITTPNIPPQNLMPGSPPLPDGDRNMHASTASGIRAQKP